MCKERPPAFTQGSEHYPSIEKKGIPAIWYNHMPRTYFDRNTPIAARATPEGRSALAVIRVAGPGAIEAAARCFSRPNALLKAAGYQAVHGWIRDPQRGEDIDEVVALVFRAPHSFTGEDSVELMCHGSPAVTTRILELLYANGIEPALPGEFTFRAFVEGKTDLVRAEAINELTHASCEAARRDALARLSGTLSARLGELRSRMVDMLAEINACLDYPEEEVQDMHGDRTTSQAESLWMDHIQRLIDDIDTLIRTFPGARLRQEGFLVVIAGRPNAGKSSLFNLLLREERAIVSPEPGTTRDWIEAWISIGGYAVRLVDTAGLRESPNTIEAEGVKRSAALLERADLILYLVDGTSGLLEEDLRFMERYPDALFLWNKADLPCCGTPPAGWIAASARDVHIFAPLEALISSRLQQRAGADAPGARFERQIRIASERQLALLERSRTALDASMEALRACAGLDIAALHLREAAEAIGEITGEIVSDEVLARMFSTFCLGK